MSYRFLCELDNLIPDKSLNESLLSPNNSFTYFFVSSINLICTCATFSTAPELTGEIGEEVQVPGPVIFLPYLSGERTPYNDAEIRGQFLNLSHRTDRADMTRAILEAVAFAFRDSLEALAAAGTKLDRVMAVGGGSSSAYWLQVLADVLNVQVDLPKDGDFGAAFASAVGEACAAFRAPSADEVLPWLLGAAPATPLP